MNINTKKIIALFMVGIFGIGALLSMFIEKGLPEVFTTGATMIIAFYFGHRDESKKE